MECLSTDQVKKINKLSIAQKHNCSQKYVRMVLVGDRPPTTDLARAILADGHAIIKILEGSKPEKESAHV